MKYFAGYNDIILIPSGATTIKIQELEPTNNYLGKVFDILLIVTFYTNKFLFYCFLISPKQWLFLFNFLAIRNSSGYYYLNGNWQIEFPRKLKFAGTYWHYERHPQGYVGQEFVHASGPTTEPIFIAVSTFLLCICIIL